jgi:hypothetical protein
VKDNLIICCVTRRPLLPLGPMKRYLIVALFASSLNAQTVTPTNAPVNNTFKYALDTGYQLTGKALVGEHNVQYTHIFDESFKISVQGDFFTNYEHDKAHNSKDEWTTYLKDRYLRVKFTGSPFVNLLGFKTGWEVRYHLPVDDRQQQAGSYGLLAPRLVMAKQFNSHFNLTLIPKFSASMNRRSYQLNGSKKGNDLGSLGIEIIPQWVIMPGFTLTYDPDISVSATGSSPSNSKITYTYTYGHDLELLYTLKNFHNIGIGSFWQVYPYVFGNGTHDNKPENDLFKGVRNRVGLRFLKSFDL